MNIVSRFTIEKNIQYKSDEGFRNNINFILTFVSILIFGLFAIRPSINTITGLIKDIDEYRKVNGILIEKISILNEVQSNPERLKQETDLVSRALPTSPDEGTYIRTLNFIASKNEIQMQSVNFTIAEGEADLDALSFEIVIQGSYPKVVNFVADFNKLLRITNVETINISPIGDERVQAVAATISGKTYFLSEND